MDEVVRLQDELRRALDGDPWHGASLVAIVGDISAAEASARPIGNAHSIWEIVLHLTGWAREVARRCREGDPGEPAGGDWPAVAATSAAAWDTARGDLLAAHEELIRAVRGVDEERLDEVVGTRRDRPAGTGISHYVMLHGVSQHVAYHAGQIALLKKAERLEIRP